MCSRMACNCSSLIATGLPSRLLPCELATSAGICSRATFTSRRRRGTLQARHNASMRATSASAAAASLGHDVIPNRAGKLGQLALGNAGG